MKKIILFVLFVFLFTSLSFALNPIYKGEEYPVRAVTLDKLKDLSSRLFDLWNDIDKLNLQDTSKLSDEMSQQINRIMELLVIEEIHSEDRQFNIRAIREISLRLVGTQVFFKGIPDECDKAMRQTTTIPIDVVYLGKIKDISREAIELLQEVDVELSGFKQR